MPPPPPPPPFERSSPQSAIMSPQLSPWKQMTAPDWLGERGAKWMGGGLRGRGELSERSGGGREKKKWLNERWGKCGSGSGCDCIVVALVVCQDTSRRATRLEAKRFSGKMESDWS